MSSTPVGRRRRPQELLLPDGKKIIVSLPEDLDDIRRKYANNHEIQVEVVVHGSLEHSQYLQQSRDHHEERRRHLRERHGAAFDEWESVHNQLDTVTQELQRLEAQVSGLHGNFSKFGYSAALRAYDNESGVESSHASISDKVSEKEAYGSERAGETTKLFKRPVVKQWFHQGLLWRASEQTEIMAIELFIDLLYVGIIHTNGEHMAEDPTGHELLRFSITFIMTWKIWTDVTTTLSWFETDDVVTRLEILFCIACLFGFTTNMINSFNPDPLHNTYTQLVAYYLAARIFTAFFYATTAYLLPMVKGVMLCQILNTMVTTSLWIASVHVDMPGRLGLIVPALALDMFGQTYLIALLHLAQNMSDQSHLGRWLKAIFEFYPANNIEHRVERMNAFVSLVLGYSVVAILFQSQGGYNINAFLGKAILGLMQAFFFNWIYFDIDGRSIHLHAIRRSSITTGLWQFAHLPFVMGYIVATAALSRLVLTTDVPDTDPEQLTETYQLAAEDHFNGGVRFFYCHGLAIALLSMGAIALSHEHRKPPTMRVKKSIRLANRFVACLILFFLPLAHTLTSLDLISITLGITVWVLIFELLGKSCYDDPFFGEKDGCCVKYTARCSKRYIENNCMSDDLEGPSGEVLALDRSEKTAI